MLASLGMSVFFVTGWMLYLDRRRKKRALRAARKVLQGAAPASQAAPWLIAFASQSGFAERLAWQAAGHLQAAGLPVQVRSLAQLDAQALQRTGHALFVISTFGDGEPRMRHAVSSVGCCGNAWNCRTWPTRCWRWETANTRSSAGSRGVSNSGWMRKVHAPCFLRWNWTTSTRRRWRTGMRSWARSPVHP